MLGELLGEDAYLLKLIVGAEELADLAPSAKLVSVLRGLRLTLNGLDVADIGFGLLLLLLKGLKMEGSMVQTLLEGLLALIKPALHKFLPALQGSHVVQVEPGIEDGDGLDRVLG